MNPWEQLGDDAYFSASPIPGMISADERRMLFWAARDYWAGLGEIVEIGAFAGLSTSYLAEGMRRNKRCSHKASRLHVFDQFQITDDDVGRIYLQFLPDFPAGYHGSFQHVFEKNTRAWSDLIAVYPGDTGHQRWHGFPIELLFIDCSISRQFHEMLFSKFYPALVPGQALLIHQDFFYHRSYYLAPMMRKLAGCFEPVASADTSMIYRYVRPIGADALKRPLFDSAEEMVELLRSSIVDFGGLESPAGGVLGTSLVFYYMTSGLADRAREFAGKIERQNSHEVVMRNLRDALAASA